MAYGDKIYDQFYSASFHRKLESIQNKRSSSQTWESIA